MAPLDVVAAALAATGPLFEERRGFARKRQALIAAHADLRERELIKLAVLASALAGALRRRGLPDPVATLAAETGITVYKVAFERWVNDPKREDLACHISKSLDELRAVAAGSERGTSPRRRGGRLPRK
jgi:hypothetical protein